MIQLAPDTLTQLSIVLGPYLNSNFVTSLVGAGAGACAGAYAAQKIAARTLERSELLNEIRTTATSFNLAVLICNTTLGLKAQHIQQLKSTYDRQKSEVQEILRKRAAGELPPDFQWEFAANLQTLSPVATPIEQLQNLVFEKSTNSRRAIILVSMLTQAERFLNTSLNERTRLIEEYRASGPHSQAQLFQFYFALRDERGTIDDRFGTNLTAIYRFTDDCIYFSKALAETLSTNGRRLEERFKRECRGSAPSVGILKIESEEHLKALPDAKEYSTWDAVK